MSSRTPSEGQSWSRRWRSWQRSLGLANEGSGAAQVKRLEVLPGRVVATVQERGAPPCDVTIVFRTWSDEEWQCVIDALSSQALYAAQLLAGDLPPGMDHALADAGVQLLPERLDEIEQTCTCGEAGRKPCRHLATVYRNLGELLAEDPWLLFRLRGRDQQGLLRGLRTQRSRENGAASARPARQTSRDTGFYRGRGHGNPRRGNPRAGKPGRRLLGQQQSADRFPPANLHTDRRTGVAATARPTAIGRCGQRHLRRPGRALPAHQPARLHSGLCRRPRSRRRRREIASAANRRSPDGASAHA